MRQIPTLLLLAALSAPAAAQHQPASPAVFHTGCEQLHKDVNTLANGSLCYRGNSEAAEYFNELSMVLLFSHPKVDQCRQQTSHDLQQERAANATSPANSDLGKQCADSRAERARLRRQIEAFADEKMPEYAAEEAPKRGLTATELLRQTRAEEAARRARVDAYIRQAEGQ
ncbi:hypothetical protein H9Q10_04295 [Eikenella sp. S3360]|uniref:Uncharacterized protein n=1 Tax=Eikenella glucosivorans TaxID=2766967 RepID=A0ABS0N9D5_9NEIS|nr:hypothetical protein [Eikenella glucosivorans]MBH5328885.1 hypothetical protein [Eikenella glucosivorans]